MRAVRLWIALDVFGWLNIFGPALRGLRPEIDPGTPRDRRGLPDAPITVSSSVGSMFQPPKHKSLGYRQSCRSPPFHFADKPPDRCSPQSHSQPRARRLPDDYFDPEVMANQLKKRPESGDKRHDWLFVSYNKTRRSQGPHVEKLAEYSWLLEDVLEIRVWPFV